MALGGQAAYRRLEREALDTVMDVHSFCVLEAGGSLVSASQSVPKIFLDGFTFLDLILGPGKGDLMQGGNELFMVGEGRIITYFETYSEPP